MIYHFSTVHPRGDVRIYHNQCKTLAENGYAVTLVIFDGLGGAIQDGVTVVDLGLASPSRLIRVLRNLVVASLYFFRRRNKALHDIVHFHDPEVVFIAPLLKFFGYKLIFDVHEDLQKQISSKPWIPKFLKPFFKFLAGIIDSISIKFCDRFVVATEFIGNKYPGESTYLVKNLPRLSDFPSTSSIDRDFGKSPICMLYIGSITEARGIFDILDSLTILNSDAVKYRLYLGGSFSPSELLGRAKSHPAWQYVEYLGWVDRSRFESIAKKCHFGMIPLRPYANYLESYPNKMFEYMAAGLPIICSDFPLWRSLLAGKNCVEFVIPNSPNDLARIVSELGEDSDRLQKMSEIGRDEFLRCFNWNSESIKFLLCYDSLFRI